METDCCYLSYRETRSFSPLVSDYLERKASLSAFYTFAPDQDGIRDAIKRRAQYPVNRPSLLAVLNKQYSSLPLIEKVQDNIAALGSDNTFTVTTAHQPNLLTGYLYFFYKILHAIRMAEELNGQYPDLRFVPVYYMGSEDNDLDELGQFRVGEQKFTWDAEGQTGAVGRMRTRSLKRLFGDLYRYLGPPGKDLDTLKELIESSYLQHETIGEATRLLVHRLFGQYGLVVIDPDDAELKRNFLPVMKDELLHHAALPIVAAQSEKLSTSYKAQAFPRPINLFYLKEGIRERIERSGDQWQVLNTDIVFTEADLLSELEQYPERFSPNVILRGLFQETILPDVAFIGGGAELAYWLQLQPLFEHYKVFYPAVYLRQSVQLITPVARELMDKLGLSASAVFLPAEELVKKHLLQKNGASWTVPEEQEQLNALLQQLTAKAAAIDPTLEKSGAAVVARIGKQFSALEQKMYRAEKRKEEVYVQRIQKLKQELFPNGGLQERVENFMPYYAQYGFEVFDVIKKAIRPFSNTFLVLDIK
ncbi:MAG TPA: bacillithiol biosynthesis cysteine-adding enzyme BshC [Chitinophagaceae bacterium]|nr:bacillithiol biosynthesis cysteine-adding enzyme BshC [Chitinophagaceae bacterium]